MSQILLSIDVGIKNLSFCLFKLTNEEISILKWNNIDLSETNTLVCSGNNCNKICKYYKNTFSYCLKHAKEQKTFLLPQKDLKETFLKKQKVNELYNICNKYKIELFPSIKKNEVINLLVDFTKNNCLEEKQKTNSTKIDLVTIGKNIQYKLTNELQDYVIDKIIIENQIGPIANKMKTIQGMISQYFIMQNNNISIEFISATNKLKSFLNVENGKITYKDRKKLGIQICNEFVNDDKQFNEWKDFFNSSKKKDDLSDCFLQGLWYIKNKL